MADQTPEEKCVNLPPLPGTAMEGIVSVELTRLLRVGDDKTSQLAVVRVLDSSMSLPDEEMVAKFYDPLYYAYGQDAVELYDPFYSVNLAYTHESAAYPHLVGLQGSIIPRFYGSFTLDFPTGYGRSRSVRLILMQYINDARPMNELDPMDFSKKDRQRIIKGVINASSEMHARNLHHRDLHQRNILIRVIECRLRVMLVDFEKAEFGRMGTDDPEYERQWFAGMYISPLLRWNAEKNQQWPFEEWIDWDWQPWLEETSDYTKSMITQDQREQYLAIELAVARQRKSPFHLSGYELSSPPPPPLRAGPRSSDWSNSFIS